MRILNSSRSDLTKKPREVFRTLKSFQFGLIIFIVPLAALILSLGMSQKEPSPQGLIEKTIRSSGWIRNVLGLSLVSSDGLRQNLSAQTFCFADSLNARLSKPKLKVVGLVGWGPANNREPECFFSHSFIGSELEEDSLAFLSVKDKLKEDSDTLRLPDQMLARRIDVTDSTYIAISSVGLRSGFVAVHCWLQEPSSVVVQARPQSYLTLLIYAPTESTGWYFANWVYLSCVSIVLFLYYRKTPAVRKKYFRMFRSGIVVMLINYSLFFIPVLAAHVTSIDVALKGNLVGRLIRCLLPDVPIFMLAGISLLRTEQQRPIARLLVSIFVIHYLLNTWDFVHYGKQFFQYLSVFDTSKDWLWLREFCPQLYASIGFIVVGWGLYASSDRLRGLNRNAPLFLESIGPLVFLVFLFWGFYQIGYYFRYDWKFLSFFQLIFGLKVMAISAFMLFVNLQNLTEQVEAVEERARIQEEQARTQRQILREVGRNSQDIVFCIDKSERIQWCSTYASTRLGIKGNQEPLAQYILDAEDYGWLRENLIIPRVTWRDFGLELISTDKKKVFCQASFITGTSDAELPYDLLVARPMERVLLESLERRVSYDDLRKTIDTCLAWFDQLLFRLKDDYGIKELPDDQMVKGIQEALHELKTALGSVPDTDPALSGPNTCDLTKMVREIQSNYKKYPRWSYLKITFPSLEGPLLVRAKAKLLLDIVEEILNDANQKIRESPLGTVGAIRIRVIPGELNRLALEFQCPGEWFSQGDIAMIKPEPERDIDFQKIGLENIHFYMRLFGGSLRVEYKEESVSGGTIVQPTVVLEFWRMGGTQQ